MSNPSHFSAGRDSGPSSASVLLWHDGKRTYRVKHRNDWLILLFFAALPVATGLNVWYEVGWSSSTGRALFLGFLFLSALWAAAFYAVKIAIRMVISPSGLTVAHGPWQGHMAWWEISRLLERTRPGSGRRYRWLVAEAGDGRRLQIRDDAVADYERFLADVHAMYRDWREQTTQIGMQVQVQRGVPYTTKEQPKSLVWLGSAAIVLALPGLYLWQAVPHAALVGPLAPHAFHRARRAQHRAPRHHRPHVDGVGRGQSRGTHPASATPRPARGFRCRAHVSHGRERPQSVDR